MPDAWVAAVPGAREHEPLSPHSWYGIGGRARYFLALDDDTELAALIARLNRETVPYLVIGAATNTLFAAEELPGLTIKLATSRLAVEGRRVTASAGYLMPKLAADTAKKGRSGLEFGAEPRSLAELVRRCRRATTRPLVVKLSPVLPDIAAMADVAKAEGADAVSVVNTIPGTLDGRLGNGIGGVSGPALLPIGVLATRRVVARTALPVIGVGGIRTASDARAYLAAGAALVAVGTAALADPRVPERIARELSHG